MERKVRGVYDALDARNYKQAIKLADAALKKSDGSNNGPLVRSLKAVALERTGRGGEALALCREVVAGDVPTDDALLSTLMLVFKVPPSPALHRARRP